jgi:transposase
MGGSRRQNDSWTVFKMSNHPFSPGRSGQFLTEFQIQSLETALQGQLAPEYRQRIEIMLLTNAGRTQAQICRQIGCSPLTARHWMLMAKTAQAHLWQEQPIGRPKTVSDQYLGRLLEVSKLPPQHFGYAFPRWTGEWLSRHLEGELGVKISARHINRLLKEADSTQPSGAGTVRSNSTKIKIGDLYPKLNVS